MATTRKSAASRGKRATRTPATEDAGIPLARVAKNQPLLALITGGNRGLGFETARQLAQRGIAVLLGARDVAKGNAAAKALAGLPGPVSALQLDVTRAEDIAAVAERIAREHGRLDILINNAGLGYDEDEYAQNADIERVRRDFDTNFFGAWRVTEALLPLMRQCGRGRIVNVSSGCASFATMGCAAAGYRTAKTALNALTRILASELTNTGILVNAVCPGWVATDMGGEGGRPVEEGAAGIVWAALLEDSGPTGGFFRDRTPLPW